MRLGSLFVLGIGALALGGCSLTKPEEEPAYIKAAAVETRVDRIEQQNTALLELQRQLEASQAEIRRLRGGLEEVEHAQKSAKDEQRNVYADLDRRVTAIEQHAQSVAAASAAATVTDHDAYQAALDHLKTRDYAGAEKALRDFMTGFPQSQLIDNAQYWLGETYYVERRFPEALDTFQRLVHDHPDSRKVPDALLKVGLTQYEQKKFKDARVALTRVVKSYRDAPAAAEAHARLKRMDAEHH
jgi:tol-pal system protein YbgF